MLSVLTFSIPVVYIDYLFLYGQGRQNYLSMQSGYRSSYAFCNVGNLFKTVHQAPQYSPFGVLMLCKH